jgi:hypothetical protein
LPAADAVNAVMWQAPADADAANAELGRLRRDFPSAAVVALVAFPRVDEAARLRDAGAAEIVSLPAAPRAVVQAVLRVLAPAVPALT